MKTSDFQASELPDSHFGEFLKDQRLALGIGHRAFYVENIGGKEDIVELSQVETGLRAPPLPGTQDFETLWRALGLKDDHPSKKTLAYLAYRHYYWGDHPDFPQEDWRHQVDEKSTLSGYWEWVWARLQP